MKKYVQILTVLTGLVAGGDALAAYNGLYLGGQLGYGNIYQPNPFYDKITGGSGGLAGRVFGGFQLNEYFAVESGFTKFSNTRLNASTVVNPTPTTTQIATGKGTVKTYAIDLVGKAILPLQSGFSLFGKLGVAYLNENYSFTLNSASVGVWQDGSVGKVFPTYGLGAGYEVSKNLTTDVSWMRIQKVGRSQMQSTDTVLAGLTYHFG